MMRHSKHIIAMLLTAICLMGILPLSIGALTPKPAPYYGADYIFTQGRGELYIIYNGEKDVGAIQPVTYEDTKCYSDRMILDVISLTDETQTRILFDTIGNRKPITWQYIVHYETNGEIRDVMIGHTATVVGANSNYNYGAIMVTRIQIEDMYMVAIFLNRNVVTASGETETTVDITYEGWMNAGAEGYIVSIKEGEMVFGTGQDIVVRYAEGYELTRIYDRENPRLADNLVLESSQIPDIIIDGYSLLTHALVEHIDTVWGDTSWLSVVPVIVFGCTISLIVILIIKKIFEGR